MLPDPNYRNVFLDSCAFDPKYAPEDAASTEIFGRYSAGLLKALTVAHSNLKEIEHPNTPGWVKRAAADAIVTLDVQLTVDERARKERILDVLAGNGGRDKMRHMFSRHQNMAATSSRRTSGF